MTPADVERKFYFHTTVTTRKECIDRLEKASATKMSNAMPRIYNKDGTIEVYKFLRFTSEGLLDCNGVLIWKA